jgi:transcriptional regulator with XRE-family HTH domain
MTQQALATELGVRQQTVSEWETGMYEPRGASSRLLDIVAEHAGFSYGDPPEQPAGDSSVERSDSPRRPPGGA